MKVKHILGVDPASVKIGLAILQATPKVCVLSTETIKLPTTIEHQLGRWSMARQAILDFLKGTAVDTAVIEYPPFIMNHSVVTLIGLASYMAVAAEACYEYGIRDIILKDPKIVRKHLGLSSGLKKEDLLPVIQRWFPEIQHLSLDKDNDQIDAVGIAYSYITEKRNKA